MTIAAPPPALQPEDYDAIEAAVLETARGRFFLAEHARRVRGAESARLLAAIERLEARLGATQAPGCAAANALSDRLSDLSWTLRESGAGDYVCAMIDALAREIRGADGAAELIPGPESGDAPMLRDAASATMAVDRRREALSWLDRLTLLDRIALFS
jgi:hypothetical protein